MAKAKRLTPKAPQHTVRLDLTEEEARTLRSILHAVGGDPRKSRRKDADGVAEALTNAGVRLPKDDRTEREGHIMFLTAEQRASRL